MCAGRAVRDPWDRFQDKFIPEPNTGCWLWTGTQDGRGYGTFSVCSKYVRAYRYSYIHERSEIPEGLEIDHLCRTPLCVNPDHLEAVTHRVNVLRGASPCARMAASATCLLGHPLSGQNLILKQNGRCCRACRDRRNAERKRSYKPKRVRAPGVRDHSVRDARRYKALRAANLCTYGCGSQTAGTAICRGCSTKRSLRRQEARLP